jgi:uncharacterized protein with FMN-binding domain
VGIYRSSMSKVSAMKTQVRSVFNTHIDMISCRLLEDGRYKGGYGGGQGAVKVNI